MRSLNTPRGTITYELTRKKVKNINLRIGVDGQVAVSAPKGAAVATIDAFVLSRSQWIINHREAVLQRREEEKRHCKMSPGDTVFYLGKAYTLVVETGSPQGVRVGEKEMVIRAKGGADAPHLAALMEDFYRQACRTLLPPMVKKAGLALGGKAAITPALRYRRMTSRWGSCSPAKKAVTLNTRLMEKPVEAVAYVVLHEMAHFIVPNHSKAFYEVVEGVMPQWPIYKKMLEG